MSNRSAPLPPERTYAQRMQDDEDHRFRMCGLLPDERDELERQEFEERHYDFIFASGVALTDAMGGREQAGTPFSSGVSAGLLRPGMVDGGARATYPPRVAAGPTASTGRMA